MDGSNRKNGVEIVEIAFTVFGKPQTAGSKQSFVPINKKTGQPFRSKTTGRVVVNTVDDNPKSRGWKNDLAAYARGEVGPGFELLTGPIVFSACFYLVRPKCHFGTGRNSDILKADAPGQHTQKPDVLKLARAVEDALTGVIWRDDCQIVNEVIGKAWGSPNRVEIQIVSVEDFSPMVSALRHRGAARELFPAEAAT